MDRNALRSSVIAGSIALVIYVIIAMLTGASIGAALVGGVILGLIGLVGTYVITTIISARKAGTR
jgi:TRAP-type C4-dicarboxylate transport system permease large subunit